MTPSLYPTVAGRSPQRHATLPTHRLVHSTTPYYKVLRSTTSCYKVLLQYSVLQSTTPHPPTSPNTAPATQNDLPKSDRNFLKTAETSFIQRAADPRRIREWSDHEPVSPQSVAQPRLLFALAMSILYWKIQRHLSKFHQILRLPRKVTYYLTIPITWRFRRFLLLDCTMSFVYPKFLNLNFLRLYKFAINSWTFCKPWTHVDP